MSENTKRKKTQLLRSNTTRLAYMGDAIFEVFVRRRLLEQGISNSHELQKTAVNYVSAGRQALAIKGLFDHLSEEEQALVKRARNHRSLSKPRNADPVDYKWATAFEALLGYLCLAGEEARLNEVMEEAAAILEGSQDR